MIYFLWIFHYSLVKGIYRKRHKNLSTSADGLAFMCLLILLLFISIVLVDKELLWNLIRKRLPMGPIVKGILLLLTPIMIFILSGRLTKQKIKTIRKVVRIKSKIGHTYSVLYVYIYILLFIWGIVIAALSRTAM